MPTEFERRLISAGIGLGFGMIPLIYGIIRKRYITGSIAVLLCTVAGYIGLPDFTPILAGIGFFAVHKINKAKTEKEKEENNRAYRKHLKAKEAAGREAMIGTIENASVANASWPPVNQVVDHEALRDFEQLMKKEEQQSDSSVR